MFRNAGSLPNNLQGSFMDVYIKAIKGFHHQWRLHRLFTSKRIQGKISIRLVCLFCVCFT